MTTKLRFVLDHDVDAECIGALVRAGHDAWTVGAAGRATASDPDQAVYADDHNAILVTHDRESINSKKVNPIGRHILLECREWHAPDLLVDALPEIVDQLQRIPNLIIEISRTSQGALTLKSTYGTENRKPRTPGNNN